MNQYKILNIIGQGAFGNAYLARHLAESKDYVIKKVEMTNKSSEQTENIFNEVKLLEEFKHVNIVSYRESIIDGQELNIIMEFCSGGDLNQLIVEQKETAGGRKLEEKKVIDWAVQIALAIFYMHQKRILHRDLKTPNIFITDEKVKLGDFGISKVLDEKVDLANTSIGTPYYMSPEQYKHKPYSYKSDIWAFGCILYEMCNQKRPFEAYSLNGLAVKVLEANFAPVSEFYSKDLRDLIKRMLQKKEKDRPSILQFLQTAIIKKRVASYLKEVYDNLSQESGDKVLLEGVLYQAKKLGVALGPQNQGPEINRKIKPEFSAQKKRQQKERIKLQLEEELKKLSEKSKKEKEELKRLEEDRKNILKGHSRVTEKNSYSNKKYSISNSASSKSLKDQGNVSTSNGSESKRSSLPELKQEKAKLFKMEEDYDMYDMEYEEEDSEEENTVDVIHEVDEDDDKHEKEPIKSEPKVYEKERYSKNVSAVATTKELVKQVPVKKIEESNRFSQQQVPSQGEVQVPIEEAIINLRSSLKVNNQKLNTIKSELSNIDLQISSSEDEFSKTVEQPESLPVMKKKEKNPTHVLLTDKINDIRQNLEVNVSKETVQKLLNLARSKRSNPTRTEIEKITGLAKIGAYHLANEIVKLQLLLDNVPLYL